MPASSPHPRARLVDRLMDPAVYPHGVGELRLKETHVSWIVLTGLYAYKIKKPVRYEFLDASTLERRRVLCEEEVRLNRRFAPELYIGVVAIGEQDGTLVIGGSGPAIEYAVRMYQFEPSQELDGLLAAGEVNEHDASELGATVAGLHQRAAVPEPGSPYGDFECVRQQVLDNFAALGSVREGAATIERLMRWTQGELAALEPTIRARRRGGAVRECHGDLHTRNVVRWKGAWVPFDCIEFDPALRFIDVMSDLAFLVMDIAAHARADLAFVTLSRYLEITGDYAGLGMLRFYAVYRALVRAKVDALSAHAADDAAARAWRARMSARIEVAARLIAERRPALVIMHGVTACGKSWLSERLVPALRAIRVRSDLERKRLQGVDPLAQRHSPVGAGPYAPQATDATYERLRECAAHALRAGFDVIVDATFLQARERASFEALARELGASFAIVCCEASRATLEARLATRAQLRGDPSEADRAVLEHQIATREPLTPAERAHRIVVDTGWLTSADEGVRAIRQHLRELRLRSSPQSV